MARDHNYIITFTLFSNVIIIIIITTTTTAVVATTVALDNAGWLNHNSLGGRGKIWQVHQTELFTEVGWESL